MLLCISESNLGDKLLAFFNASMCVHVSPAGKGVIINNTRILLVTLFVAFHFCTTSLFLFSRWNEVEDTRTSTITSSLLI